LATNNENGGQEKWCCGCRGNMVRCIECRLVRKTRDFPQVFLVAIPAAIRSLKSFAIIEIMKSRT